MITVQQYFDKYLNKGLNYDGAYGNQCMDNYHFYVKEALGFPHPSQPYAAKLWDTYDPKYYDRINNGPLDVPKLGDILVWTNGVGHVAIFKSGNLFSFTSFDQNFPTQGYYQNGVFIGTGVCHYQSHNYFGGLKGWLRPKVIVPPPIIPGDDLIVTEIGTVINSNLSPKDRIDQNITILRKYKKI